MVYARRRIRGTARYARNTDRASRVQSAPLNRPISLESRRFDDDIRRLRNSGRRPQGRGPYGPGPEVSGRRRAELLQAGAEPGADQHPPDSPRRRRSRRPGGGTGGAGPRPAHAGFRRHGEAGRAAGRRSTVPRPVLRPGQEPLRPEPGNPQLAGRLRPADQAEVRRAGPGAGPAHQRPLGVPVAGGDPRLPQPEPAQPRGPLPGRTPAGRSHPPRVSPAGSGGRLQPARPSGPQRPAGAGQPGGGLPELEGGRDHCPGRRRLRRHPPPSPRKTFPCPSLHRPWRLRPAAGRRGALLRTAGRPTRAGDRPVPRHVPQGFQDAGAGLPQRLRYGPSRQQRREPFLRSGRSPGARRPAGRGRHAVSHLRPGGDRVQYGVLPAARDRRSRGRLRGRRAAGDPGRGSGHPRMGHARALPPGAGWDRVPVPGEAPARAPEAGAGPRC